MKDNVGVKKDCFAYRDENKPKCNALKELVCEQKKCSFYKTVREFKMKGD